MFVCNTDCFGAKKKKYIFAHHVHLIILHVCLHIIGLFSCLTPQYHFVNMSKNWTEAQSYCREKYTDLVTIDNPEEMNRVINRVNLTGYTGPAWIGLEKGNSDYWQWSDQRNSSFRYWAPGKPDNNTGNEKCTVATITQTLSGTWDDRQCGENHPFLCYDDHLILVQENMTWNEALNYCRENYTDLVSVHDEEIQQWVERKARNATSAHVWLGLRFSCTLSFWFWVSAEPVCYVHWSSDNGTGTGHCGNTGAVQSRGEHRWVSLPETQKLNFICVKCQGESDRKFYSPPAI
uniref:C-type lectin domain-containing protein n=1 Tax=Scleropages formosus TaxID=113540 RepID=A0A8C9U2K2_SCLFO